MPLPFSGQSQAGSSPYSARRLACHMGQFATKYPALLSGGEQQRSGCTGQLWRSHRYHCHEPTGLTQQTVTLAIALLQSCADDHGKTISARNTIAGVFCISQITHEVLVTAPLLKLKVASRYQEPSENARRCSDANNKVMEEHVPAYDIALHHQRPTDRAAACARK